MSDTRAEVRHITIVEQTPRGERYYDLYSRLLQDRIVFLRTPINAFVANLIVAELLFLQKEGDAPIHMYVNSPGGDLSAALAIYDVMQFITPSVWTYCIGRAASAGAVLLAAGEAGHRYALPDAEVMIHQPLVYRMEGNASDVEIRANHLMQMKRRMQEMLAHHTGKSVETIAADTERDNFMTADEAQAYGLIDHVLLHRLDEPSTTVSSG